MVRSLCEEGNNKIIDELRVSFDEFKTGVIELFPHILDPLGYLFDQLLFQQKIIKKGEEEINERETKEEVESDKHESAIRTTQKALVVTTKLTTYAVRGQLYSILGPMVETMVKLYSGSEAGFSMRSFETKVFNWNAPSIFILSGSRIVDGDVKYINSRVRSFNDLIPPVRTKKARKSKGVVFGVYTDSPWRANSKECFSNANTVLFQLFPTHNIYRASKGNQNYAYFSRGEGIGFGSLPPRNGKYKNMGNISLMVESSFEFGIFKHFGPGGSFEPGASPSERLLEYEDRFVIDEIEVWGCGTEEHLAEQKLRWEWEEREAQNRQRINIDTLGEDRALLEMAGLVGKYSQSGGSV